MEKVVTAFGLKQVDIAVPTTGGSTVTWVKVPAVIDASFKQTVQEVQQNGDDTFIRYHRFDQKGLITVKATKESMNVFEMVSGNTASSISGGGSMIEMGTDGELTPPLIAVRAQITCTDESNQRGTVYAYWYRCEVSAPFSSFPGGGYGKLGEVQLDIHVYKSTVNEKGEPVLGTQALGRFELPA